MINLRGINSMALLQTRVIKTGLMLLTELNPRPNFPVVLASFLFLESPTEAILLKSWSVKILLFFTSKAGP